MRERKYMPISCAIIYFIIFAPVFFRFILKENEKSDNNIPISTVSHAAYGWIFTSVKG